MTENGWQNIQNASLKRNNKIPDILNEIGDQTFYYHVSNRCYKNYTNKSNLEQLLQKKKRECDNEDQPGTSSELQRSSRGEGRTPLSFAKTPYEINYEQKCIICDNYLFKKVYKKFRVTEEERGKAFLKASSFFQDAVFTRTCDIQDEHAVFGADLYYHRTCMLNYIKKYTRLSEKDRENCTPNPKQQAWQDVKGILDKGLQEGKGYELSAIHDYLN